VNLLQTILVLAVIPLAIYALVAMLTMRDKVSKPARYRSGQEWDYEPVWWTANPAGVGIGHGAGRHAQAEPASRDVKGGASGNW
jgi:hypothetical protein